MAAIFPRLLDQVQRKRIAIRFTLARLNRSDDDKDCVQDPEQDENGNANEHNAEDKGNRIVNEHRQLEIERFLALGVDLRRIATFGQPNNQWA